MENAPQTTTARPLVAGLRGRCPRCGEGRLFEGFLAMRPACEHCGLDFGFADSADGPAFFAMFFSGFVVVVAALVTEVLYQPPFWLHAVLWVPAILITSLAPLRPLKGLLIALQYRHRSPVDAREGDGAR